VAVGAVLCQSERTPAASQRSERFAPFSLDQWDSAPSSTRPAAPSRAPRRRPARPSRCPRPGRTPRAPGARFRGRRRPAPTPESADAPRRKSRSRSRSARSTASPSATRAGSRPSPPDRAPVGDESQADAPAAPATTARPAPTTNPAPVSRRVDGEPGRQQVDRNGAPIRPPQRRPDQGCRLVLRLAPCGFHPRSRSP
jgi:hypothetical protein